MSFQMLIEPLGETIEVEEGQTILDAALRQGIYLPHACGHGLCGSCKIEVIEGEVDHGNANIFALMEFERDNGKTLACCATLLDDIEIEAEIDEEPDAEMIPVEDHVTQVSRIVDLTPTVKAIFLKLDSTLDFQPGQYIQLQIPNVDGTRAFSIANAPQDIKATGDLELNIKLVKGGAGTTWLHEQLKVGDKLTLSGPYGRFFVRKSAKLPMLFLAGGTGLSSPRSMIKDILSGGCELPIILIYGQRNKGELYYHDELMQLSLEHSNFKYVPSLSEPSPDDNWEGAIGFVHDVAVEYFNGDLSGQKAYLCGPPVMIESCISSLMQGRLFERDIYAEKFISAADTTEQRSPLFKHI
ncbi:MAG: 2Fe-2S iron-sulfur cluster binding domain-containing protein [Flavobacteriales bacterium]|jgi:phenol/toluene 2-monooxygenase (NADH) P5/A5|nr:2Fe-2S iron-sulfur cluster binding domain-containing protein [Flavobacteriales bacterium]